MLCLINSNAPIMIHRLLEKYLVFKHNIPLIKNTNYFRNPTPIINDNLLGNLIWKPLERDKNLKGMNFGRRLKMIDVPEGTRFNFWDDLRKDYY